MLQVASVDDCSMASSLGPRWWRRASERRMAVLRLSLLHAIVPEYRLLKLFASFGDQLDGYDKSADCIASISAVDH